MLSTFSSFGLNGDLFFKPQISAIGGNVYSTISAYATQRERLDTMYDMMSGTSMATPYIAGYAFIY